MRALLRAAACAAALCAGCGGAVAPDDADAAPVVAELPPASPVGEADFPGAYARAVCDNVQGCCAANALPFDHDHCVAAVEGAVRSTHFVGIYSPEAGGQCVAGIAEQARACGGDDSSRAAAYCVDNAYVGPHAPGEDCSDGKGCAYSPDGLNACVSANTGGPPSARCALLVPAQLGQTCWSFLGEPPRVFADCTTAPDLRCDPSTSRCAPRTPRGGACTYDLACAEGLFCAGGACAPVAPDGAPCAADSQCGVASFCQGYVCAARAREGEPCDDHVPCAPGLACVDALDDGGAATCRSSPLTYGCVP